MISLRPQIKSDAEDMFNILGNNKFEYLGVDCTSVSKTRRWISNNIQLKKRNIKFTYSIILNNAIVGFIDISYNGEIGYCVGEKYWGQGIATESVKLIEKMIDIPITSFYIITDVNNIGSCKVAEKSGYTKLGMESKNIIYTKDNI